MLSNGYAKERYYRKLKHVELTPEQIGKIKAIAIARCASNEYRREDLELRCLMIKLADFEFLEKLTEIPARKGSRVEGHKKRMIAAVLQRRKTCEEPLLARSGQLRRSKSDRSYFFTLTKTSTSVPSGNSTDSANSNRPPRHRPANRIGVFLTDTAVAPPRPVSSNA